MRDSHVPGHDYHLVDPSPWPAIGALSVFVLAGGLIWFMHEGPPWILISGILGVLYTMFGCR